MFVSIPSCDGKGAKGYINAAADLEYYKALDSPVFPFSSGHSPHVKIKSLAGHEATLQDAFNSVFVSQQI